MRRYGTTLTQNSIFGWIAQDTRNSLFSGNAISIVSPGSCAAIKIRFRIEDTHIVRAGIVVDDPKPLAAFDTNVRRMKRLLALRHCRHRNYSNNDPMKSPAESAPTVGEAVAVPA